MDSTTTLKPRRIDRILLVWPPSYKRRHSDQRRHHTIDTSRFPLGLGYLAAYLERELPVEVRLLDMSTGPPQDLDTGQVRHGMPTDALADSIRTFKPQMVGISQMFSFMSAAVRELLRVAKTVDPSLMTVLGGTHPTVAAETCMSDPHLDFCILGEGERPLYHLVRTLSVGRPLDAVPALARKVEAGQVVINSRREWIDDLGSHVRPDRTKLGLDRYTSTWGTQKTANMITSRGCPYTCSFCTAPQFYQKRFNGIPPKAVVDEMEHLVKDCGIEQIIVQDENNTHDLERMAAVADEIVRRRLKVSWFAESGTMICRLSPSLIDKLAAAGVSQLRLPLESGDLETRRKMRKPGNIKSTKATVEHVRKAGIRAVTFLLIGMPEDTVQSIRRSMEFATTVPFDWYHIGFALPLPGTEIYERLRSEGKSIDTNDIDCYSAPYPGLCGIDTETLVALREHCDFDLNFTHNYNLRDGDIATAVTDFGDLTTRFPNDAKTHHFLGLACIKSGDIDRARQAFTTAASLDPRFGSNLTLMELDRG